MAIHLKFGTASHGWLPADLEVDGTQLRFTVSYVPRDFFRDLTNALHSALRYEGTYVASVNEEPTESDWTFIRTGDALVFSVVQYPDMNRGRGLGRKIVDTSGTVLEVVLPFWRALRELDGRRLNENFKAHWSHAFPTEDLEKLTLRIDDLKQAHGH